MTVANQTNKVQANGNGVAFTFSFSPMVIFESTDLQVIITDEDDVDTVITEGTGASNFSVSVATYPGTGSVTYPADSSTALTSDEHITIKRVLTLEQDTDLENQGGYFPDVLEESLDRLTMVDLQQQETIDRSFRLGTGDDSGASLEIPVPEAGKVLAWNNSADALINTDTLPDSVTVSSFGATVIDDASAVAVRTTIGSLGNLKGAPQVFTASGTWSKPANLSRVVVEVVGAGGGGGGVTAVAAERGGGAGGGGGYAIEVLEASELGSTETVTIGAGGNGANAIDGTAGGTSSFGSLLSATGGGGGEAGDGTWGGDDNGEGGTPGIGSGGDVNIEGQGGGEGSFAGNKGFGGVGGCSQLGGGGQSTGSGDGATPTGYGAGGGGAGGQTSGPSAAAGGAGAAGLIIVWEFE